VATGQILWQTYTAPVGFTGNSVWGSAPAVDLARNQLYVATGNNFSAPASYHACIAKAKNANQKSACNPGGNYFDSVLALKLTTGEVNWVKRVEPFDTWNVDCFPFLLGGSVPNQQGNCGFDEQGPDFDFAQAPILYTATGPGQGQGADYVGVGQKSGVYWALRPSNGDVLWSTRTGPGGLAGGHQWGSASDGQRIYTSNANSFGALYTVPGLSTRAGIFSALDARTGSIIWQIANPELWPAGAPATIANGVMYVCSGGPSGYMYALDAATGSLLWSFVSGTHCGAGATVADGVVYWGTGYSELYLEAQQHGKLYAFELPAPP
jgi:polyvinyl alcohol dehydrogenase (cytochrome)